MSASPSTSAPAQRGATKTQKAKTTNDFANVTDFVGKSVTLYAKKGSPVATLYGEDNKQTDEWQEFECELLGLQVGADGKPSAATINYLDGRVWKRIDYLPSMEGVVISLRERVEES